MKRNSQKTHTAAINKKHSEGGTETVVGEMFVRLPLSLKYRRTRGLTGTQKSEPPSPHHTLTQKFLGELILRSSDCHYLFQLILFHSMSPCDLFLA